MLPDSDHNVLNLAGVMLIGIDANENVIVKKDGDPTQTLNKFELGAFARSQAEKSADQPIVIAADKSIKYETVMEVMSKLKENGVKRVGLAVKTQ